MDEEIEEEISKDDSTPSILQQAEKEGWKAGYYDFGKADNGNYEWFNPAILQRGEEIWMLVRGSEPHPQGFRFGQNSIWAFEMDSTGKIPKRGIRLRWDATRVDSDQHFEDPRGFYHEAINQTIIGACTFIWYPDGHWTGAHQCIGSFDENWQCSKMDYPKIGGGSGQLEMLTDKTKYEKNWLPFLHDNRLHILYKANPWMVVGYGQTWSDVQQWKMDGVKWAYGDVRGGTSPIRVGDYYFTFPHSSLPWRGRYRRYYAGGLAFDVKPPFRPVLITPEPLLRGSQNDFWAQKKPLVVFPCGAIYRDDKWLVTCGVNDMKAAWVEIPHEDLLRRMVPINKSGAAVFPANGLSESEIKAQFANTEAMRQGMSPSEAKSAEPPKGLGRDGNKPLMRNRQDDVPSPTGSTDGDIISKPKLSGEALKAKQRENAAKARAARAAKRMVANSETGEPSTGFVGDVMGASSVVPHSTRSLPRRKRRRKKRTAQEKLEALQKFEAQKKLVSSVEQ